eukprot:1659137-Heterocapsa_arctica.AAC.1
MWSPVGDHSMPSSKPRLGPSLLGTWRVDSVPRWTGIQPLEICCPGVRLCGCSTKSLSPQAGHTTQTR